MRKIYLATLPTFLFLLTASELVGQVTQSKMTSTTQPSSTIQGPKHLEKPQSKAPSTYTPPPVIKATPQVTQQAEYLHPGILVFLNGKWEGSDHLLNLSHNIGVYVTVVKPEAETLDITQEKLQKKVEGLFTQGGIKPVIVTTQGQPPLPAFEIEIFVYPIEKGYAACCSGRLFESVTLDRFKMDPGMAFQAITWEKQALIVGPKSTFSDQLNQIVESIASSFIERYQAYEKLKSGS
jgi:hypothetical protein